VVSASSEVVGAVVLPADLHARPAGQVTRAVAALDAVVHLSTGDRPEVDARSVLAVMALGAVAGDTVRVRASGTDASAAVTTVTAVLAAAEAVAG
jgi:phosphocarrier protein HPr